MTRFNLEGLLNYSDDYSNAYNDFVKLKTNRIINSDIKKTYY